MSPQPEVKDAILSLIGRKDLVALKKYLEPWHPADLAPLLAELPVEALASLFRCSNRDLAAATFGYLPVHAQKKLLRMLSQQQAAELLNALPPDDRTVFIDSLPLDVAMQMLSLLSPEERKVAQDLLAYPAESVGRMMTLDFIAVRPEWSVAQALDFIRENGYDRETLNVIYVVDEHGRLIDDVRARRFL
ncbi:MAG: CBS domain-containing protein, partial [Rariglobus sp.]|nr:CBS domain-containing protein [Rariglobus sp.]